MEAVACAKPANGYTYARREPEKTALFQTIQRHLLTFEQQWTDEADGRTLPSFVTDELHDFLGCGILARGFAHLACHDCGLPRLVPFTCAGRGFCPTCMGRRMNQTTLNLLAHVLQPLRQWVLTLPFPLRAPLAYEPGLMALVARVFEDGFPAPPESFTPFTPAKHLRKVAYAAYAWRFKSITDPGAQQSYSIDDSWRPPDETPGGPARQEAAAERSLANELMMDEQRSFLDRIVHPQEDRMAFLDKLKGELVDIIEWNEDGSDTVVWRFPRYQDEIKNGAQLTVRPGQTAVFVNQGQVADIFAPGMHTLETQNLPILSTLAGWRHGFDSPFKAEVYFVSTRQFTDLKWGTKNPVMLRDPELGPLRLRAFGSYVAGATDPRLLVEQVVGSNKSFTVDSIREQLRNIVASRFADLVASCKIPALNLSASYDELATQLCKIVAPDFARFGFTATQVLIENIALPEEVERALDKRTSMGVVGNLDQFARFQAAQAMEAAAKNPGGSAGSVLGLGVGLGLAGQMAGAPPPGNAFAGPPPLPGKAWWVALDGQQNGPHDLADLASLIAQGRLARETLAWKQGQPGWLPVAAIAELAALFGSQAG